MNYVQQVMQHQSFWVVSESFASEKLEGEKLNVAEVTQSEIAQKQKLQTVLERINDSLKLSTRNIRWNVDCKYVDISKQRKLSK